MLDSLLGRRTLKERIDELEAERDSLESQLEAESERRQNAVRDRQEAEERVNRLEDRIADLEGNIETERDAENEGPSHAFRETADLRGERLDSVLSRLESVEAPPEGALTAVLDADGALPDPVRERLGDRTALLARARPCVLYTDDAGVVSVALRPPRPPAPQCAWSATFELEREWFQPSGDHTLALVRSDCFALGVYDGSERGDFEGFESDVMNQHSKGGFSQDRFERRRDEQIDRHLDRCRETIAECAVDPLIVLGQAPLLEEFADRAVRTMAVDATGAPRDALASARRSFWTTRLFAI